MSPAAQAFEQELIRLIDAYGLAPGDLGDPVEFGARAAKLAVEEARGSVKVAIAGRQPEDWPVIR